MSPSDVTARAGYAAPGFFIKEPAIKSTPCWVVFGFFGKFTR
jgi:hypothetical protein